MVAVNIRAFRGAVPRVSERLQQPNFARRATNVKITSGKLEPLLGPLLSANPIRQLARTLYRNRFFGPNAVSDSWMTWEQDVDVVENPAANDEQGRIYFTSESFEPRMTTNALATQSAPFPTEWFVLGVQPPVAAPTVTPPATGSTNETRSYAMTFVTQLGEESGPSPASTPATGDSTLAWSLTNLPVPPANSGTVSAALANTPSAGTVRVTLNTLYGVIPGEYLTFAGVVGMTDLSGSFKVDSIDAVNNYVFLSCVTSQTYTSGGTWTRDAPHNTTGMVKRLYRTAGDEATFLFVAELAAATTTYSDTVLATALGETLPTLNTLPPPKGLTGLIDLPNGCLAGLNGNELCFSDPYMPYSWPLANRYSFAGRGVALVESANSVIVLTQNFPIMFTGSDPEVMSPTVMETYAPCVSKRGVANVGGGAMYPSFDGLYLAAPGRVEKLTTKLYREVEWGVLQPATMDAAYYDSAYYATYLPEGATARRMWKFDPTDPDSAVEFDVHADAVYRNNFDGDLYLSISGLIYRWDSNAGSRLTSDWLSVAIQLAKPTNFAVAQIHAEYGDTILVDQDQLAANESIIGDVDAVGGSIAANEILALDINGSNLIPVVAPLPQNVQFTLYVDDEPVFTKDVSSSTPFRLPAGYLSEVFRIGLSPYVPVYSVSMAQTPKELSELPQ
jgi:hypothetical protein